ncbi:MAG: hypothetical protein P9L89_06130 [Candidatus Celaenobacter polaris]|nr:hypothetical protein [Candidatus Celaenobacter polaris]
MNKPKYDPESSNNKLTISPWDKKEEEFNQLRLLENQGEYHRENS